MKKKGFTLVELLAVIAILAILVIVAMPNVLGMFNQAKANTFVTEVQKYMDTAKTSFMTEAMSSGGKEVVFTNKASTNTTDSLTKASDGTTIDKPLAMDGSEKTYVIWFSRNGDFNRVVIYDDNFCYDSNNAGTGKSATNGVITKGTTTPAGFDKSTVDVLDVVERTTGAIGTGDSISVNSGSSATNYFDKIYGCMGTTQAKTE